MCSSLLGSNPQYFITFCYCVLGWINCTCSSCTTQVYYTVVLCNTAQRCSAADDVGKTLQNAFAISL